MAITKSNPITPAAFGIWWLISVHLFKFNTYSNLGVTFLPYNGEYWLSTTPARLSLDVNATRAVDATFDAIMNSLWAEIQRQYSLNNPSVTVATFDMNIFDVNAGNPERPVTMFTRCVVNGETKTFMIMDIFGLASTDMTFAVVLNNVINEFGRQGKLATVID